jgi:very-short-patch-repair endonuclease
LNQSTMSPAVAEAVLEAYAQRKRAIEEGAFNGKSADRMNQRSHELAARARGQVILPGEDGKVGMVRIEAFQRFTSEVTSIWSERFDRIYAELSQKCESPIEKMLLAALLPEMLLWASRDGELHWEIVPQFRIPPFRADFLIRAIHDDYQSVIVECDGHDFHDRTKDQVARDKKRDRTIQAAGYPVLRFTGSELHNDPQACADEVLRFIGQQAEAV